MKTLNLITLFCLIASAKLLAQSPQAIEADLLKSFKKIDYWDEQRSKGNDNAGDSLIKANDVFGTKLKNYTSRYPASIKLPFSSLKKARLDIFSSTDDLFRIYSWDTWTGGTMHIFANVLQYKVGSKTKSSLIKDLHDGEGGAPFYSNLYTFKTGSVTYYLGIWGIIESSKYYGAGIKVFAIQNDVLNNEVKIIKTKTGLHNDIFYEYDFGSILEIPVEKRPTITFDQTTQTIHIPLVDAKGQVTQKFINYKFNCQYFEKIKS